MSLWSLNFLLHRTLKIFDFGFFLQLFSDTDLKDAPGFMLGPIFVKKNEIFLWCSHFNFLQNQNKFQVLFDKKLTKQLKDMVYLILKCDLF